MNGVDKLSTIVCIISNLQHFPFLFARIEIITAYRVVEINCDMNNFITLTVDHSMSSRIQSVCVRESTNACVCVCVLRMSKNSLCARAQSNSTFAEWFHCSTALAQRVTKVKEGKKRKKKRNID